jgi:hypothetical protein
MEVLSNAKKKTLECFYEHEGATQDLPVAVLVQKWKFKQK